MIKSIHIRNYRSILNNTISFEPITVLIGANGSGKSNLVKALQFLSDIPDVGIGVAVSKQGGRESVIPKSIPENDLNSTETTFSYCIELPSIDADINSASKPTPVRHNFRLKFPSLRQTEILEEELKFESVLFTGEGLAKRSNSNKIAPTAVRESNRDSFFTLRQSGTKPEYELSPKPAKKHISRILHWLGLPMLEETITQKKEFDRFLESILKGDIFKNRSQDSNDGPVRSFLDPRQPTMIDFSQNFQLFIGRVRSIKRYDLLLHELRNEQSPSDSVTLSTTGENMPAAFRGVKENSKNYSRLENSFEAIAPHISKIDSAPLQTGKEFVQFYEDKIGRGVESWQSSDGTLRALAILVAIESANRGSTIIIEEIEQNIHPWAVRTIMDHIRTVVEENDIQVILTTHSEHVLERLDSSEVRVVTRDRTNGTEFKRLDQLLPDVKIDMGDIGRLWVQGLLGGVPTHYE